MNNFSATGEVEAPGFSPVRKASNSTGFSPGIKKPGAEAHCTLSHLVAGLKPGASTRDAILHTTAMMDGE
jgi:hypothetical protein